MIKQGSRGDETRRWQAFLDVNGYDVGTPDGIFGPRTTAETAAFQAANGLQADGVVGGDTYTRAVVMGFVLAGNGYLFLAARWFEVGREGKRPNLIVLHTTEGPETDGRSAATAAMFHEGEAQASAHFICDPSKIYQCVLEDDTAWHSGHKATNLRSFGIEQCGTAQQTPEQWADDASTREIANVARLCAWLCRKWDIPVRRLSLDELQDPSIGGFVGHADVTDAFNKGKGHHDPGSNYVWDTVLAATDREIAAFG